jgi:uncharacterized membrane protein (UPF0136 family)
MWKHAAIIIAIGWLAGLAFQTVTGSPIDVARALGVAILPIMAGIAVLYGLRKPVPAVATTIGLIAIAAVGTALI